jgi:ribonucleoside-diphosphate reductase alpha chain
MDGLATSISIALQYGVPMKTLVTKFSHTRFEPSGFTNNPQIPIAKSVMDYIFRWLASKFLSTEEQRAVGIVLRDGESEVLPSDGLSIFPADTTSGPGLQAFRFQQDAPSCQECGSIMVRAATCYSCLNCGSTSGCG